MEASWNNQLKEGKFTSYLWLSQCWGIMGDLYPPVYTLLCFPSLVSILQRVCITLIIKKKKRFIQKSCHPQFLEEAFCIHLVALGTKIISHWLLGMQFSGAWMFPGAVTWSCSQGTRTHWWSCRQGDGNCILDGSDGTSRPSCSPSRSQCPWSLPGEDKEIQPLSPAALGMQPPDLSLHRDDHWGKVFFLERHNRLKFQSHEHSPI